jgi:hypothetical protein
MRRLPLALLATLLLASLLVSGCGGSQKLAAGSAATGAGPSPSGTAATTTATTPAHGAQHRGQRRAGATRAGRKAHKPSTGHASRPASTHHSASRRHARAGSGSPPSQQPAGTSGKRHQRPARKSPSKHKSNPPSLGSERVAFKLHGGSNATLTACGLQHHDRVYPSGSSIVFSGAVTPVPSAQWKVKVKIKICQNGSYVDLSKFQVPVNNHTGSFSGSFPAPASGLYEATARLYITDVEVTKSLEIHFEIS